MFNMVKILYYLLVIFYILVSDGFYYYCYKWVDMFIMKRIFMRELDCMIILYGYVDVVIYFMIFY